MDVCLLECCRCNEQDKGLDVIDISLLCKNTDCSAGFISLISFFFYYYFLPYSTFHVVLYMKLGSLVFRLLRCLYHWEQLLPRPFPVIPCSSHRPTLLSTLTSFLASFWTFTLVGSLLQSLWHLNVREHLFLHRQVDLLADKGFAVYICLFS